MTYRLIPVAEGQEPSHLLLIGWAEPGTLRITFRGSHETYEYSGVPKEHVDAIHDSEHPGREFDWLIKKGNYPCRKIAERVQDAALAVVSVALILGLFALMGGSR